MVVSNFTRWLCCFGFVPPPNFPQTIQYKGVTSIIYKTKDLAPRSQTLDWLGLPRSRTEAVTIVAHG
jgi:hypothetical protein